MCSVSLCQMWYLHSQAHSVLSVRDEKKNAIHLYCGNEMHLGANQIIYPLDYLYTQKPFNCYYRQP